MARCSTAASVEDVYRDTLNRYQFSDHETVRLLTAIYQACRAKELTRTGKPLPPPVFARQAAYERVLGNTARAEELLAAAKALASEEVARA